MNLEDVLAAKAGDKDAMARLLKDNEGLITRVAKRYCRDPNDHEDTMQAGRMGFIRGVYRFDARFGTKPISIIHPYIRSAVQRSRHSATLIKVPIVSTAATLEERREEHKRKYELRQKLKPTNEAKDVPMSRLVKAKETVKENEDREWASEQWDKIREELSEREFYVVERVHRHGLILSQVATELGVTRQRVQQIASQGVKKLYGRFHFGAPPKKLAPKKTTVASTQRRERQCKMAKTTIWIADDIKPADGMQAITSVTSKEKDGVKIYVEGDLVVRIDVRSDYETKSYFVTRKEVA